MFPQTTILGEEREERDIFFCITEACNKKLTAATLRRLIFGILFLQKINRGFNPKFLKEIELQ